MTMLEPAEILVTGGNGRLGRALGALGCRTVSRDELDITDEAAVIRQIATGGTRCVINAAAYTAVDAAETYKERAEQVNSFGAGCVARAAAVRSIPCIHISTDCVFGDADPAAPVVEIAKPNPLSVYGLTKWRGEQAVLHAGGKACIARVAWLFDDGADTFIGKMLKIAHGRDVLSVVDDEYGRPTPVAALAKHLVKLAEMLTFNLAPVPEILHVGTPRPVNRFEWAERIFGTSARLGGPTPQLERVSADAFPTPARRPRGLVLDVSEAERLLGPMPQWVPFSDRAVNRLLA